MWKVRPTTVTLNLAKTHQTVTGWEFSARASEFDKRRNRYNGDWLRARDQILRTAVYELGLNRVRIEIPSGAENPVDYWSQFESGKMSYKEYKRHFYEKINDNNDPNVPNPAGFQFSSLDYKVENFLLPMRALLEERNEKLVVNVCYVDFGWTELKGTLNLAKNPAEYAELITETFKRLRDVHGVAVDYFELILEPDNTDEWRGKQIGEASIVALARLRKEGFSPKVIAPSTSEAHRALPYLNEFLSVPGTKQLLGVFSYHRYGPSPSDALLTAFRERARELNVEAAMLEYTNGGAEQLHADLTLAGVSSWQAYSLLGSLAPEERLPPSPYLMAYDLAEPHPQVVLSGNSRLLKHYFSNIRLGAVRLGASSSNSAKKPVLFRNPNGSLALVLRSDEGGMITISGLPPGNYDQEISLDDGEEERAAPITVAAMTPYIVDMPGTGVLALTGPSPTTGTESNSP
jgi:hypothetical protein